MPVKIANNTTGDSLAVRRYKHSLRKTPYLITLLFLLAATCLTLLNIYTNDLIHVVVRSPGPLEFETKYGLYRRCTRKTPIPNSTLLMPSNPLPDPVFVDLFHQPEVEGLTPVDGEGDGWQCQEFPSRSECQEFGESFCVLWSTAGYAAQSSLVPCGLSLLSLLFIFLYRGQRTSRARARRHQWKIVSFALLLHVLLQALAIGLILGVFQRDERFQAKGSHLDSSFIYGVISAAVSAVAAILLAFTGLAAKKGKAWAAGTSARKARRHRRTRSGRVVPVPEGHPIPKDERVTVGEIEAILGTEHAADERTALLEGSSGAAAGGGEQRATDDSRE